MKKKGIAIILLVVIVIASLSVFAACDKKDDGKLHITFYHTMGSNLSEVLNEYIAKFETLYPAYKVDAKQVGSYDDVRNQVSSEIMTGKQPNLAYCYPDHVALYNIAGAVQTLDDYINSTETVTRADGTTETLGLTAAQKEDFIEGYYNEGKQFGDGLMYSMPFSKSTEVLYYNKTFFEKNNLKVPTTWDEMEAVCAAVKKINSKIIPLGYDSESNWFITMCEQLGSPYTAANSETKEGHFLFNNDTNKEFMLRFVKWYKNGYVTTQELNGGYTSDLFKKQEAVMCIGSSAGAKHQIPEKVNDKYPFEAGITSIPQINPSNPKVISQGPSVCIFRKKNTEEVKASWLFLKYLTTNASFQADFSIASGYVPVIKSAAEDPVYQEQMAAANGHEGLPQLSAKVCIEQEHAYYASPAFYGSSKARDEVGSLIQKCFTDCSKLTDEAQIKAAINAAFGLAISNCVQSL